MIGAAEVLWLPVQLAKPNAKMIRLAELVCSAGSVVTMGLEVVFSNRKRMIRGGRASQLEPILFLLSVSSLLSFPPFLSQLPSISFTSRIFLPLLQLHLGSTYNPTPDPRMAGVTALIFNNCTNSVRKDKGVRVNWAHLGSYSCCIRIRYSHAHAKDKVPRAKSRRH